MAERSPQGRTRRNLDASGPREVVYCHQCTNEWHHDEYDLICPECNGIITEIITPGPDDPRRISDEPPPPPLHDHNPWADAGDTSDPEEADIEEHVSHGPGGSIFSRTIRTTRFRGSNNTVSGSRSAGAGNDPDLVVREFQNMIGNLMGPHLRHGTPGRSGPETLFSEPGFLNGNFRLAGNGIGPSIVGGRITFTSGFSTDDSPLRPRDTDGPQAGEAPPVDDIATYAFPPSSNSSRGRSFRVITLRPHPDHAARIIESLLGAPVRGGTDSNEEATPHGASVHLHALFSAMLNPAHTRFGDAVYSQEALDQIISNLMDQAPTSNAPGPASPDAIAALPKKKLDKEMLGAEGKGECSVCMDDVKTGDEVVVLPCNHWFHETCAGAWLSEHNTCPICRKGIDAAASSPPPRRNASPTTSRSESRAHLLSSSTTPAPIDINYNRNQARLNTIRNLAEMRSAEEPSPSTDRSDDLTSNMPGSFYRRGADMSDQRDSRGPERPRNPRQSSAPGNGGNGGSSGPINWLRDRWGGHRRTD